MKTVTEIKEKIDALKNSITFGIANSDLARVDAGIKTLLWVLG